MVFGMHRQLFDPCLDCLFVAKSQVAKKSGDRVKFDRRDSMMKARLLRVGELTSAWVTGEAKEAQRDLYRLQRQSMQILLALT